MPRLTLNPTVLSPDQVFDISYNVYHSQTNAEIISYSPVVIPFNYPAQQFTRLAGINKEAIKGRYPPIAKGGNYCITDQAKQSMYKLIKRTILLLQVMCLSIFHLINLSRTVQMLHYITFSTTIKASAQLIAILEKIQYAGPLRRNNGGLVLR